MLIGSGILKLTLIESRKDTTLTHYNKVMPKLEGFSCLPQV